MIMVHTKRIRMLSDPYVKLADPKWYNTNLTNELENNNTLLETSKKAVYERIMRLKMIIVCAIENNLNDIDLQLTKMKLATY